MKPKINLPYVIFLAATASLGGLLFGFDIAIITGAGPFLIQHFKLSDLSLGWAFSSLLFGCVIGSTIAGRLTDFYGRRRILLWVAVLFAVTSVATGLASSFTMFVAARFAGGLAVGAASILSPMYIAEVAPAPMRGRLCTLYQMSIVTGILMSYYINYLLRDAGPANWRWMFVTGVIPSLVFFLLLLAAPESPRYLFAAGKQQRAVAILERIAGRESALVEAAEIRASLSETRRDWRDLLRPGIRRAVVAGFCLAILVHVSGINTIIDYAPTILKSAGWQIDAALFSTFILGLTNFAFTLVSFWAIDRYGRKPLYIGGSLGMCRRSPAAHFSGGNGPLSGLPRAGADSGLPGLFRLGHRTSLLDADGRDIPESYPRHRHDRAGAHAMGCQRFGRPLLSIGVPSGRQGNHVRLPGGDGAGSGYLHVVFCPGNQGQDSGGNRRVLEGR